MRLRGLVTCLGLAVVALTPFVVPAVLAAGAAASGGGGTVSGSGSGLLLLPPFTGDRVTIVLAHPGRFDVTHVDKTGQEFARLAGRVTCAEIRGSIAFLTGEIDRGHAPDVIGDPRGQTLAITIANSDRTDLAGLSPPSPLLAPCTPAPLDTVIDDGDFTVTPPTGGSS